MKNETANLSGPFQQVLFNAGRVFKRFNTRRLMRAQEGVKNSGVLLSAGEKQLASAALEKMRLPFHHDQQKNWDTLKVLSHILEVAKPGDAVLDAGSGAKSVILDWLYRLGYKNLHACDRIFQNSPYYNTRAIRFKIQDMSSLDYPKETFKAIACISVVEHGVDIESFFREMSRVLVSGGRLLVSTDYWDQKIDCSGKYPYGEQYGEMKVFSKEEAGQMISLAERNSLKLVDQAIVNLDCREKAVTWERMKVNYTFLFLAFEKK